MRLNAVLLSLLPLAVLSPAADAQTRPGTELQRCRGITDSAARLACYDALADSPAVQAALAQTPAQTPAPAPVQPSAPVAEEVESHILGFDGWTPRTRFKLANGQVWQVVDDSVGNYQLKDPKVKVHRAALGSFLMEIDGAGRQPRVRRVE